VWQNSGTEARFHVEYQGESKDLRAGGMGGAARRRGGSAESVCQMVFISLEVQLFSVGYSEYSGYPSSGYSFAAVSVT